MQNYIFIVAMVGTLLCVEARLLLSNGPQTKQGVYVSPGKGFNFSTDSNFIYPGKILEDFATTDASATLVLSCSIKLLCSSKAYIKVTDKAGAVLAFYCSNLDTMVQMPVIKSVQYMKIKLSSGEGNNNQYKCRIESSVTPACKCGTKPGRIVGGTQVMEGEIPWQVGLGNGYVGNFRIFCGGTLVSDMYVITAAHCIKNTDLHVKIFLGSVNLQSSSATVRDVATITQHESYDSIKVDNDIVVIKLAAAVIYSQTIFPACLPRSLKNETFAGRSMVISGWGMTAEGNSNTPTIMLKATVLGLTNIQCKLSYSLTRITSTMLCAKATNTDSCQGDSGGPLTYTSQGVTYLAGVVSWGIGCARPQYPGVYARVTEYLDWIDSKTGGQLCSK